MLSYMERKIESLKYVLAVIIVAMGMISSTYLVVLTASYWPRLVIGGYVPFVGLSWCTTADSCIHESGHASDDSFGNISNTKEYHDAVIGFATKHHEHPWSSIILSNKTPDWTERYAQMLSASGGNEYEMPVELRQFYNWTLIAATK